jgi:hypothetical protein
MPPITLDRLYKLSINRISRLFHSFSNRKHKVSAGLAPLSPRWCLHRSIIAIGSTLEMEVWVSSNSNILWWALCSLGRILLNLIKGQALTLNNKCINRLFQIKKVTPWVSSHHDRNSHRVTSKWWSVWGHLLIEKGPKRTSLSISCQFHRFLRTTRFVLCKSISAGKCPRKAVKGT